MSALHTGGRRRGDRDIAHGARATQCLVAAQALVAIASAIVLAWPSPCAAQALPKPGDPSPEPPPPLQVPPLQPPVLATTPAAPTPPADAAAPAGPSFVLREVRFNGASVIGQSELQALAAPQLGQLVTLRDLEAITRRVTQRYREAGYPLAQALLPAQDIKEGAVEISVLEGRVDKVRVEIDPEALVDEATVQAFVARIPLGQPLQQDTLTRAMLLLSDLPGVKPAAAIEAGAVPGSSELIVSIGGARRWEASFDADNHGTRSTSEYRVGTQLRWNGPLRHGDNLDLRLQTGTKGGRNGGIATGRLAYEHPLGGNGTRLGLAASTLQYALGGEFADLDATGHARVVEASLMHPLIRSRPRNLSLKATLLRKQLRDEFGIVDAKLDKHATAASLALNFENRDELLGGGYSSAGVNLMHGRLGLGSAARALDDRRTEGSYTTLNYSLSRLQTITPDINAYLGIAGQLANKNLDAGDKIALGGPRGVRAYAPSEATGDEGHVLNAELRWSPLQQLSLQLFHDWGWVRHNKRPLPTDTDHRTALRGWGIGAHWASDFGLTLRATLAWRGTKAGQIDDRNPRLLFQLSYAL